MNFATSPEQDALVGIARRFGQQHLAPFYQQQTEGAFDRPTLREMGRLGFFGVELQAAYGGLGLNCVTAGLILETLSAADYNIGQLMVAVSLNGQNPGATRRPEVVQPWLQRLTRARRSWRSRSPSRAAAPMRPTCACAIERDGDEYVINGEKTSISAADQADAAVVFGRTGPVGSGAHGVSACWCRWTCRASPATASTATASAPSAAARCSSRTCACRRATASATRTRASCR